MDRDQKKTSLSVLVFFALSLMFAFATIPASKLVHFESQPTPFPLPQNVGWVYWFLIVLSLVSLLPVLGALIGLLHRRRLLPQFLDTFFQEDASPHSNQRMGILSWNSRSLATRLALVGGGICILVAAVFWLGIGENRGVSANVYEVVSEVSGIHRLQTLLQPNDVRSETGSKYVGNLMFYTNDNNPEHYFRNCTEIVARLKRVGAKAVLIDAPTLSATEMPGTSVQALDSSGIVVFGLPQSSAYYAGALSDVTIWSKSVYTLPEKEMHQVNMLSRIRPIAGEAHGYLVRSVSNGMSKENASIGEFPVEDVTLQLVRKYCGYSAQILPRREGNTVVFGDYRIPVTTKGWMYCYRLFCTMSWFSMYVRRNGDADSLTYTYTEPITRVTRTASDDDLRNAFNNKIVILNWYNGGDPLSLKYTMFTYAGIVERILSNSALWIFESGSLFLTLLLVVCCSLIAYFTRGLLSVLMMVAIGVCALCFGTYLAGHCIFIDVLCPLLAMVLSMLALPSVAVVYDLQNEKG